MNRIVRIMMLTITVAALAVVLISPYHHVAAQGERNSFARAPIAAPTFTEPPSALTQTTKHVLVGTYINQGIASFNGRASSYSRVHLHTH